MYDCRAPALEDAKLRFTQVISAIRARTVTKIRGAALASAVLLLACGESARRQSTDVPATTDAGVDGGPVQVCPLDTTFPPPVPECSDVREATAGKWTEESEARWSATPDPHDITILVRGAAPICSEGRLETPYLAEWNWQSQRCVRGLIDAVGGVATDERFWLVDIVIATLSWSQIQAVGAHPDVQSIGPEEDGSPPP